MLVDSKGSVFPFFVWKMQMLYGLFEALFGCRENDIFYAHLEPLLGFREKRVFCEKPSFAKAAYFTVFTLWTPLGDLIFLLFAELWTKVNKTTYQNGLQNEAGVQQYGTLGTCRPGHLPGPRPPCPVCILQSF